MTGFKSNATAGDRISQDRLALWISLRLSGVQDDTTALARVGWAVRRLTGGPGPEQDLAAFLDRRDPENLGDETEPFVDRASGWLNLMGQAADLHPITRAAMGFHLWRLVGLGQHGDQLEAVVAAARIAASEERGAVFAPLAMGGASPRSGDSNIRCRSSDRITMSYYYPLSALKGGVCRSALPIFGAEIPTVKCGASAVSAGTITTVIAQFRQPSQYAHGPQAKP